MRLFIANIAASLLMGILGTMLVPVIQRWLAKRSAHFAEKTLQATREEYEQVISFAVSPEHLAPYVAIRAVMIGVGCFAMLISIDINSAIDIPATLFKDHFHPHISTATAMWVFVGDMAIKVLLFVMVFKVLKDVYELSHHVRFFEQYVKEVPESVRNLRLERAIFAGREQRLCVAPPESVDTETSDGGTQQMLRGCNNISD